MEEAVDMTSIFYQINKLIYELMEDLNKYRVEIEKEDENIKVDNSTLE